MKTKKKKKWIKWRHKLITALVRPLFSLWAKLKYGFKKGDFDDSKKRQYLIISNHQTAFDQFFVGLMFKRPLYYVASEDLFAKGILSKLLTFAVAPIPIKKSMTDIRAVMTMLKVRNEGGSIAIFPEGNRTFSGKTGFIKPSIVSLIKTLKLPLVIMNIQGGYGTQPRWADKTRKGKTYISVKTVVEAEDFLKLSDEDLYDMIKENLYVSEGRPTGNYPGKNRAEYLDRAMYVCPYCGLSRFYAKGDHITCTTCNRTVLYGEDKVLKGVGFDFPFEYVEGWYDYQTEFLNGLKIKDYLTAPMWDERVCLYDVVDGKKRVVIEKNSNVLLFSDRYEFTVGDERLVFPFDGITAVTVLGRNKVDVYKDGKIYQLKGDKHFNGLIFTNVYYHYLNETKGDNYDKSLDKFDGRIGKFLGL